MSSLVPESVVEALLDDLASDGHLVRGGDGSDGVRRWHFAAQPLPQGYLHRDGNRYWVVDLSRMPPLYQELYDRVYATRLELWGASAGSIVGRAGGILLFGGPDEAMRAQSPRIIAGERIRAGDHAWVEEVRPPMAHRRGCCSRRRRTNSGRASVPAPAVRRPCVSCWTARSTSTRSGWTRSCRHPIRCSSGWRGT